MKPIYEHTQRGSVMLAILVIATLGFVISVLPLAQEPLVLLPLLAILALMAATMITFGSLTVKVDPRQVQLVFGPGWLRRSFSAESITGVRVVRNAIWMGLGIHFIPGGLIYNVSGLDGVEIIFRNGRKARIGTDEPAVLARAIEEIMANQ